MEIHPVGGMLIHTDGRDKAVGASCNYVNVPKTQPTWYTLCMYNDYLFKHSNMFWPFSQLQGYH